MWIFAIVIALSRVIIAAHYPSDVIAGACVGGFGALLIRNYFAARRLGFVAMRDGSVHALPGPSSRRGSSRSTTSAWPGFISIMVPGRAASHVQGRWALGMMSPVEFEIQCDEGSNLRWLAPNLQGSWSVQRDDGMQCRAASGGT